MNTPSPVPAPARDAAPDPRLSFAFAKRHGVIVNRLVEGVAECTYRATATPAALAEVRRYLRRPLKLERIKRLAGVLRHDRSQQRCHRGRC